MKKLGLSIQIKLNNFQKKFLCIFSKRDHKINKIIINLVQKIFQNLFIKIRSLKIVNY